MSQPYYRKPEPSAVRQGSLAGREPPAAAARVRVTQRAAAPGKPAGPSPAGPELNASQALGRFSALSHLMNVGVVLLDAAAEAEFGNSIACRLLECSVDGVRGRWSELKRMVRLDPQRILGSAGALRLVADVPAEQGVRSLRLEIRTLDDAGRAGYLVLLRDRRMMDALEANLLLACQMRSLVHAYRALTHELRSPLNSMQLTLDLLADPGDGIAGRLAGPHARAGQHEHYLTVLREALGRLNATLKLVLEGSEPLGSEPSEFDLREVLREVIRLMAPQARRQRVNVDVKLPDRPVIMSGCRDQIRQALINLALHALEAMPAAGYLAIDLAAQGAAAVIGVRHGWGGDSDGVLDEAYRVHPGEDMKPAALGLYLARVVVESHGGEFLAAADPGQAMRFDLTLPLLGRPGVTDEVPAGASAWAR
jgi:signal transduction histidine kinase